MTLTNRAFGLVAVGVLRLRQAPPPAVLQRALQQVQARHPLLQVRIVPTKKTYRFERLSPLPTIPLKVLERRDDHHALAQAQQMLNEPLAPTEGPLMRCVYLVAPDQRADLICAFHHAIMDAPSAAHCYHELLTLCARSAAEHGLAEDDALPQTIQPAAEALLPPAFTGFAQVRRLVPFLFREMRTDRHYRRRTTAAQRPSLHPPSTSHILSESLSASQTQALVRQSRQESVTLHSTLAAAMLSAVVRQRYPADLPLARMLIFSNLRPYLKPPVAPEYLGCYIAMQRLTIPFAPTSTLWTLARSLQESLHAANKRGEKYLSAVMSKHIMQQALRTQNDRMATAALSYVGPVKLQPTYGSIEVTDVHGFITPNRLSPEWSAFGHLFRGQLHLDFMYMRNDMDAAAAQSLVHALLELLRNP